jgi:hypothetical protein
LPHSFRHRTKPLQLVLFFFASLYINNPEVALARRYSHVPIKPGIHVDSLAGNGRERHDSPASNYDTCSAIIRTSLAHFSCFSAVLSSHSTAHATAQTPTALVRNVGPSVRPPCLQGGQQEHNAVNTKGLAATYKMMRI